MGVQVVEKFAAPTPGDTGARCGEGGEALVDLQGQDVRADLSRELEPEAALEVGVPGARLNQQVGQARCAEVDEAGGGKPRRESCLTRHGVLSEAGEPARPLITCSA
ncbi:hypothetical protein D3C87_1352330 [compost metagenome]